MEAKEERIRAITKLYYSNPKVQEALVKFGRDREVVPRYFEGFGKRPDSIQYPSDVQGPVFKGATSFHCSQEIWKDPLKINSDGGMDEMNELRKGWDLLIDIDSPFLDYAKIAAKLIIKEFKKRGIKNYGIKFSGSKGFHIIVSSKAFPEEYEGVLTKDMFPEWPRAITEYLMYKIREEYSKEIDRISTENEIEERTDISKEDFVVVYCTQCNKPTRKGNIVFFKCNECGMENEIRDHKITKKRLKCLREDCPGIREIIDSKEYHYCENCKDHENKKIQLNSDRNPEYFEKAKERVGSPDLILVSSRHLFRMPYSLHEKTALASVVLSENELDSFNPNDANPLQVKIRDFIPNNNEGEAEKLLGEAINWKKETTQTEEEINKKKYSRTDKIELTGVTEDDFPESIKKLLNGLKDGRKRGLFILITFLRSCGFSPEYINEKVREWNKKNDQPLKEGYVKSQIDWHLKQKKQILPPNYENPSFYRDLGLIDKKQDAKNPIVDVLRRKRKYGR